MRDNKIMDLELELHEKIQKVDIAKKSNERINSSVERVVELETELYGVETFVAAVSSKSDVEEFNQFEKFIPGHGKFLESV